MEKVLVVDDEIEVCKALSEFLNIKGYEVEIALDGPAALKYVRDFEPHIVLLDIRMPGMDGLAVLKKIKASRPDIGVIMVTAVTDHELAKSTFEFGAYDYITKPVDLNYLENVLMVKILDLLA